MGREEQPSASLFTPFFLFFLSIVLVSFFYLTGWTTYKGIVLGQKTQMQTSLTESYFPELVAIVYSHI